MASGLYGEEHFIVELPHRNGEHYRFNSYGSAMNWLSKNEEEIRQIRHRNMDDRQCYQNKEEYEHDIMEMEDRMRQLVHREHFRWSRHSLSDMTAQELMNLLVALKQTEKNNMI